MLLISGFGFAQNPSYIKPYTTPPEQIGQEPGAGDRILDVDFSRLKLRQQPPAQEFTYPPMAKIDGLQGEVVVQLVVNPSGRVQLVRCLEGPVALHEQAMKFVQHMAFEPFLEGGRPAWARACMVLPFRLRNMESHSLLARTRRISLSVGLEGPLDAPGVTQGALEQELRKELAYSKLPVSVGRSLPEPGTLNLEFKLTLAKLPDSCLAMQLTGTGLLVVDPKAKEDTPGPSTWSRQWAGGSRGEKGAEALLKRSVQALVCDLGKRVLPAWSSVVHPDRLASASPAGDANALDNPIQMPLGQVHFKQDPGARVADPGERQATLVEATFDAEGRPCRAIALDRPGAEPAAQVLQAVTAAMGLGAEPVLEGGQPRCFRTRFGLRN